MGDKVEIVDGEHKDMKGVIASIDEDRQECLVQLKNGSSVKVSVFDVEDADKV